MSNLSNTRFATAALLLMSTAGAMYAPPAIAQDVGASEGRDEIIVTARKRSESLQDVPAAISVRTGADIDRKRIVNVESLVLDAPGLFLAQNQTFGPAKSETYITLRGVGATTPLEPAVAVFIDGVYQPKLAFDIGFLELERVEILRGPQGALFGRNTQGGAINMVSKKPSDVAEGKILLGFDEHETYSAKAYLSGPISEGVLFGSVAVQYRSTQGFIENATLGQPQDDQHSLAGRASLRYVPNEDFEAILTLQASTSGGGQVGAGVPTGSNDFVVFDNDVDDLIDDTVSGSLSLDWDIGSVTLTSITGYSDVKSEVFFDLDGSAVGTGNFQRQSFDQDLFSEEIRLASNSNGALQWLAGVYYFQETYDQRRNFSLLDPTSAPGPVFNPGNTVSENALFERQGWALFGQVNYDIFEDLELSVGARYSEETIDARQFGDVQLVGIGVNSPYDATSSEKFIGFSPMASLSYRWNENVLTYATVAEGYKAGGFPKYPFSRDRTGIPFDSETSVNYELGFKANSSDGRFQLNAAAFIIDISDQQLVTQVDGPANIPVEAIDNVGASANKGFEIDGYARLTSGLKTSASISYIDAKFTRYLDQNGSDRAGEAVPYIPGWSGNATIEYEHAIGNSGSSLNWSAKYNYIDSYIVGNGTGTFDPLIPIRSSEYVDLRLDYIQDGWSLSVYVDNVFDSFNVLRTWQSPFHDPASFSFDTVLNPRTFGAQALYEF